MSVLTTPATASVKVIVTSPIGKRKEKNRLPDSLSNEHERGSTDGVRGELGSTAGFPAINGTAYTSLEEQTLSFVSAFVEKHANINPTRINTWIAFLVVIYIENWLYKVIYLFLYSQKKKVTIAHISS